MNTGIMKAMNLFFIAIMITMISLITPVHANAEDQTDDFPEKQSDENKAIENLFLELRPQIDAAAGITYKPKGKIRHTVYMFSSTECSHCSDASGQIKPLLDKYHAELKILFCGFNEPPRKNGIQVVCRKLDLDTYNQRSWKTNGLKPESECVNAARTVDKSIALSNLLKIHNLPTFFLETGHRIVGAKMIDLEKELMK
jgi:hypothetical protein